MTEIVGERAISVAPMHCRICDIKCGRFPYSIMFAKDPEPAIICRSCYRIIMAIEYMKLHGAYEVRQ